MLDWGKNNMKEDPKTIIDRLSALVRGNITAARVRYCGVDFLKTCQMVRDPIKTDCDKTFITAGFCLLQRRKAAYVIDSGLASPCDLLRRP